MKLITCTTPDEIVIEPNPQLGPTTQHQKESALTVLFVELTRAISAGCEVNIDDPLKIIVMRPSQPPANPLQSSIPEHRENN
jgi:hypothetical protein